MKLKTFSGIFAVVVLNLSALASFSSPTQAMPFESRLSIDVPQGNAMEAGMESSWKIKVIDMATGQSHTRFMEMHTKHMHLIVVKSDLSTFAHIHPYLNLDTGEFSIGVNTELSDPDNFGTVNAVPFSGKYFFFNELMPMPVNEVMPMVMGRGEFVALASSDTVEVADPEVVALDEKPATIKYYTESGELGTEGDVYKVKFSYEQFLFCDIWMPKFYIRISERDDSVKGGYSGAENFQKWLGMGGHSVVISKFGEQLAEKKFYHLHGFLPMAESGKFTFPYDDHRAGMPDGPYKIWSQVKKDDIVFTFENVFDYKNPPIDTEPLCFVSK